MGINTLDIFKRIVNVTNYPINIINLEFNINNNILPIYTVIVSYIDGDNNTHIENISLCSKEATKDIVSIISKLSDIISIYNNIIDHVIKIIRYHKLRYKFNIKHINFEYEYYEENNETIFTAIVLKITHDDMTCVTHFMNDIDEEYYSIVDNVLKSLI